MKSQHFYCPHCGTQLEKSAAAWVLGEVERGFAFGDGRQTVSCPACGRSIDVQGMIDGKYDRPARGPHAWIGTVLFVVFLVIVFYYMTR